MELRKKILDEAHTSMFTMHSDSNKMYQDLKQKFWWTRMKREIAKYVSECDVCQRVKTDHLKPAGTLQLLAVPAWKWEDVHMDFIVGLPRTQKGYDSIWVIIDRLTKSAHFLPVKTHYTTATYAETYISRIVSLHGVPETITSDRGSLFVSRFWEHLQTALGTKLIRSSAYHPQTSGQVERVNQILEDMLRACALTYSTKWDECLPLAEFAYNNSYQKSLEMAPFEAIYGKRVTFGPNLVTQAEEQVKFIHNNLKTAQSRHKSNSDKRRRPLVFEKDDHVYLRVSPMKGALVRSERQVSTMICWSVQDHRAMWASCLSTGATTTSSCGSRLVSRLATQEVLTSARGKQHDEEPLTSTKCSGVITPKKRQLGSKKNSCEQSIPDFFHPLQIEYLKPCNVGIEKVVDQEIMNNIGIKLLL
ncbi:hypothetical protein U9M48_039727 [Paspalum notatum var. saurae]|uniref:Integrase catalytic domain-containing protein n=1 Tax=Paspalum notatum var. saurae TaxID=547442 RepID=A0AAQ3UP25_PASNO